MRIQTRSCSVLPGREQTGSPQAGLPFAFFAGVFSALLLERHEVEGLLDMNGAIEAIEAAFREQGEGKVLSHAPVRLILENRSMRVVQGALLGSRLIGYRLGRASGFKKGTTIAVLCDSESGDLLTVMSYTFGSVRTGATFGVATKYLARKDAENVGIIGTGRSAMVKVLCACARSKG